MMEQTATRAKLQGMGAKPIGNTPEDFGRFIAAERAKWAQVIKDGTSRSRGLRHEAGVAPK